MLSVAAAALIAAGTSFANAQGTGGSREGTGGGSGMQQGSPSTGHTGTSQGQMGRETSPSSGMKATQSEQKSPGAGKNERTEDVGQKDTGQKSMGQKSTGTSSENERATGSREDRRKGMKAEDREDRSGNTKAEGREDRSGNMRSEGREDRSGNTRSEGREDRNGNMRTEDRDGSRTQTTTGQAGAAAKLSSDQRTRITTVIRDQHVAPADHVNFSVSVGTRVPREVRFHPLPAGVVSVYPEWRGYEFFLVRDEIVVVDPQTLEIVAVLPA